MPICLNSSGCTFINVSCDDRNPCTTDTCDPFVGCKHEYRVCLKSDLSPKFAHKCGISSCNESTGNCTFRETGCGDSTVVIAASITGGVIAGIIIGIALCFALAGGGATAYYKYNHPDMSSSINSNPLYEGVKKGGENPLHSLVP